MSKKKQLTANQKRFCEEYVKDNNGTRSYLAVYSTKNADTAGASAAKTLQIPAVKEYLKKLQAKHTKKLRIEAEDILRELKHVGMARIDNVLDFDDSGVTIKNSKQLSKETLASVQSVSFTETDKSLKKEVKLYDKISALKQLGESLGLFKDFDTLVRGVEQYGEVTWHEDMEGFSFRYADSQKAKA